MIATSGPFPVAPEYIPPDYEGKSEPYIPKIYIRSQPPRKLKEVADANIPTVKILIDKFPELRGSIINSFVSELLKKKQISSSDMDEIKNLMDTGIPYVHKKYTQVPKTIPDLKKPTGVTLAYNVPSLPVTKITKYG